MRLETFASLIGNHGTICCDFGHDESCDANRGGGTQCVHDTGSHCSLVGPNDSARKFRLDPLDATHQACSSSLLHPSVWPKWIRGMQNQ